MFHFNFKYVYQDSSAKNPDKMPQVEVYMYQPLNETVKKNHEGRRALEHNLNKIANHIFSSSYDTTKYLDLCDKLFTSEFWHHIKNLKSDIQPDPQSVHIVLQRQIFTGPISKINIGSQTRINGIIFAHLPNSIGINLIIIGSTSTLLNISTNSTRLAQSVSIVNRRKICFVLLENQTLNCLTKC